MNIVNEFFANQWVPKLQHMSPDELLGHYQATHKDFTFGLNKTTKIFDPTHELINFEDLHENTNNYNQIRLLLECQGIWHRDNLFGLTWKVHQIKARHFPENTYTINDKFTDINSEITEKTGYIFSDL